MKYLILGCLLGVAALGRAQAGPAAEPPPLDRAAVLAAAQGVSTGAYPDADTVLVDEYARTVYRADGTASAWDEEYTKVLTEKGRRERQTYALYYMLPYETAVVHRAEIIKPDGRVVPVDLAAQSRVMVERSQMDDNIYNPNYQVLQVNIPDLETGDLCHLVSSRETVKPRVPDTWSDYAVLESETPIVRLVYEIVGPTNRLLARVALRDEIPGAVTHVRTPGGNGVTDRWEVRAVPRMFSEPNMPPLYTVVQRLLVSTVPDWAALSRWYWDLCRPHLEATTPEMEARVRELVRGADGAPERIARLFRFVSQEIRYMGITTEAEAPGYEPHDVRITFENRYGVCRDKAALLVALLRLAGVEAYPVLIDAGAKKDADVPLPYFNHAIVAARGADGALQLMDPTDENTRALLPAYLCDRSYLVATPAGEPLRTSPIEPATNNLLRAESAGRLDADGTLTMRCTLDFDGINDGAYRNFLTRQQPEERRRFLETAFQKAVPGATVTDYAIEPADLRDTRRPLHMRVEYRVADYPVAGPRSTLVPLPWVGSTLGMVNFLIGQTGLERRKYPLVTDIACGVRERVTVELPEDAGAPLSTPGAFRLATNTLTFAQAVTPGAARLRGEAELRLDAVEFSPAEYLVLKRCLRDLEYQRRRKVILGRAGDAARNPDARVLSNTVTYALAADGSWTETWATRLQVLTYAGKKDNAELHLDYNPAWQELRLRHARVIQPDGRVLNVATQELNTMDADWVAAAPRYPPARTLVVSLPGVEIGSILEYACEVTQRGMPLFSCRQTFRTDSPADGQELRVTAPHPLRVAVTAPASGWSTAGVVRADGAWEGAWTLERQPGLVPEADVPPAWSGQPSVFLSSGDWRAYAATVHRALRAAADGQPESRALARRLTAGKRGADALRALRDHVAVAIRPAGPSFTELPLDALTPADRTLREGYGHNADRAILLYALLRAAGFRPEFVLASSWAPGLDDLLAPLRAAPAQDLYDTVLVRTRVAGREIYLNDTDQYDELGSTGYDGQPALDAGGRGFLIRAPEDRRDRRDVAYRIELDADGGARVTRTQRFHGKEYGEFRKRYAEMPPEERRRHHQELVAQIAQSARADGDLVTRSDTYPGVQELRVRVDRYAVRDGAFLYLGLPRELTDILGVRGERRCRPLYRGRAWRGAARYTVTLPAGFRAPALQPEELAADAPAGLGRVRFTTAAHAGPDGRWRLELGREADLGEAVVPAADYGALRDLQRRMARPAAWTLLAEEPETGGPRP